MGCKESKGTISEEEKLITKTEDAMGIHAVDSQQGIFQLKTHSHNHKFSQIQLKQAFGKLNLELTNFDNIDSSEAKFYNKLKEDRAYNERDFVMLLIILGSGKKTDKAHMIFEEWDIDINKKLTREEMAEITGTLNNIFVDGTVELSIALEADETNRALLEKYRDALNVRLEIAAETLSAIVFPNEGVVEVSEAQFIEVLGKNRPNLLTSFGYRKFISELEPKKDV